MSKEVSFKLWLLYSYYTPFFYHQESVVYNIIEWWREQMKCDLLKLFMLSKVKSFWTKAGNP